MPESPSATWLLLPNGMKNRTAGKNATPSIWKQPRSFSSKRPAPQSNERVSELLRNLGNNSPWLVKPELVEITSGNVTLSPRDQRRVANFTMRIGLKRPTDVQKAATGAAGAASVPVKG